MGFFDHLTDPPRFWRHDPSDAPPPRLPATIERGANRQVGLPLVAAGLMMLVMLPVLLMMPEGFDPDAPSLLDMLLQDAPLVLAPIAIVLLIDVVLILVLANAAMRRKVFTIDHLMVATEIRGPVGSDHWREPLATYKAVALRKHSRKRGRVYVVSLVHPRRDRAVPLFIHGDGEVARQRQHAWAAVFKVPAVEV